MARGARRMNSLSRVQLVITEAQWNKAKSRGNLVLVHFANVSLMRPELGFLLRLSSCGRRWATLKHDGCTATS